MRERALLVPQRGITRNTSGQATVLTVGEDNKVTQKAVTTERVVGNQWLVSAGLAPGDRVIVDGVQKARPGGEVRVVDAETPAPAGVTTVSQPQ